MRPAPILLTAMAVAACATLRGPDDAQLRYRDGLDALARGDFVAATAGLEFASRSDDAELSRRALMLLAATELDPTNPGRNLDSATRTAARLREISTPGSAEHMTAISLERVAAETRGLREDLASLQNERQDAWATIDSLHARVGMISSERDSVRRKALQLEVVGDSLTDELKKKTQELDRIRRAIRG